MSRKQSLVVLILCLALVAFAVIAVALGAVSVDPASIPRLLLRGLGIRSVAAPQERDVTIIVHLRLPRVISAILVGASLAVCGVVMQGLFRNPMASPEILGVSAGGSLGAVIAITSGISELSLLVLPASTIGGAFLAATLIYFMSSFRGSTSLLFIVIAGMAISSFFNGITSVLLLFAREHEVASYIFWTMGGLDSRTWQHILVSAPVLVPGMAALMFYARELDLLSLGEEGALALGMNVETGKRILLALSAAVTGVAISVAGPIGFIGLLVPHLLRLVVGSEHRVLMPAAALGGAVFLLVCDLLGRTIAPPFEIRVGIITAILGSPYLLFLVARTQRRGMGVR